MPLLRITSLFLIGFVLVNCTNAQCSTPNDSVEELTIDTLINHGQSLKVNGLTYNESGTYTDTVKYANRDCDSILYIIDLKVANEKVESPVATGGYDGLIYFAMILFILSLATERFANFAKIWLHEKEIRYPFVQISNRDVPNRIAFKIKTGVKKAYFGNLRESSLVEDENKIREGRIILINFIIGFGIALFVKADIFTIIANLKEKNPINSFGWESENFDSLLKSQPQNLVIEFFIPLLLTTFITFSGIHLIFKLIEFYVQPRLSEQQLSNRELVTKKDILISSLSKFSIFLVAFFGFLFYLLEADHNYEANGEIYCFSVLYGIGIFVTLYILHFALRKINTNYRGDYLLLFFAGLVIPVLLFDLLFIKGENLFLTQKFLGFQLTAAFLSLGSKFWHDLLDVLFKMKNYRQKLSDPMLYEMESAAAVKKFAEYPISEQVNDAYFKFVDQLSEIEGVVSIGKGRKFGDGLKLPTITVHVEDSISKREVLHASKRMRLEKEFGTFPLARYLDVIVTGQVTSCAHGRIGIRIRNSKHQNGGNLGVFVKKKGDNDSIYLLTCFHVLATDYTYDKVNESVLLDPRDSDSLKVHYTDKNNTIDREVATLEEGRITHHYDYALAKVSDHSIVTSAMDLGINPIPKSVEDQDTLYSNNKVYFNSYHSADRGIKRGVMLEIHEETNVLFSGIKINGGSPFKKKLYSLIVIAKAEHGRYVRASEKGDSGALVIHEKTKKPLAMIIADSDKYTYCVPIKDVLDSFNLEIY